MSTNLTKAQLESELKLAQKKIARLEREAKKAKGKSSLPVTDVLGLQQNLQDENKYKTMVEQLPLVVYINPTDDPSYTVYISPQIESIFGYSAKEWLADPKLWSKTLHPQDRDRVLAEIIRVKNSGEPLNIEYRMMVEGDRSVWVHDEIVLVRNEEGAPQFWQGYMIDITGRKQVEEALYKSEERFRTTFDHMLEGAQIIGFDWKYIYINTAAEKHNRRPNSELLGKHYMEAWPEVEGTDLFFMIKRCMEERIPFQLENEYTYLDGTRRWFELSIQPIPDGIFILSIDITERKQAKEALTEQEFWLNASQRAGRIGSYVLDIKQGIWNCSDLLDDIFGIAHHTEKTVNTWNALLHPDQREEMLHYFSHHVVEMHQPFNKEYQIIRQNDGQVRWVWGQGELSMDEQGNPSKMFGMIQDITERKQAEQDLLKSEQRYRLLFENMPIAIWEEDFSRVRNHLISLKQNGILDFREYFSVHPEAVVECGRMMQILDLNETALKMYDAKSKGDLINSVNENMTRGELETIREVLIAIAYGMTSSIVEGTDETLNGEPMEISLSWSIAPGYEHDYSKIIVTTIDITERKRAEEAIGEWKNRYEAAIKASGQLLYDWNPITNTVTYAGDIKRILGYTPVEMEGGLAHWVELVHPEDRNMFNQEIKRVIAEKKSFYMEYRLRRKDNTYMAVQDEGHFLLNNSGNILQMVGFIQDITERKAAEEKLQDSKRFFQYALDALSAHIAILDEDGIITAVNKNWREFGQLNKLTLIGEDVGINYLEICRNSTGEGIEEANAIANAIQEMLAGDTAEIQKIFEYPCHSPLENRWFVAGLTKFEEHGKPRIVVSHENITQRKLTEQNIERRVVELEALYQSGISFSQTLDEKDVGEKVIEILSGSLNWHHAAVRVRRPDTDYVELLASIHPGEEQDAGLRMQSAVSRIGEGLSGWVIEHGKPLRINNLSEDPRYVNTFEGMKSGLYIPMRTYDKTIGSISAESDQLDAFTEKDEHLLITLATQAAIAIQNAELFKEIQNELARRKQAEEKNLKQLARLTALQEIDRTIISTFDIQLSLNTLLSQALQLLAVDAAAVLFINEEINTLDFKAGLGFQTDGIQGTNLKVGESYAGKAALEQQMVKIPNLERETEILFPIEFRKEGFVSYYGAPLIAKGKVIGVLEVFHRSFVERDEEWLGYFGTLAELAAIAIDNANLYSISQYELAERKLAEEALLQSYAGLEWRVKERTADLKRANLELEQALRIKDEFLASMSHELRTPLNAIIGLSESLGEQVAGPLNEKQQKYIHTIGESGHHLLDLINDILDLAKIEAGYMDLNINIIQVETLCNTSIRMIKELAQKKSLNISYERDEAAATVSGDERKLKQTLVNLLGNAVKFTPAGGSIGLKVAANAQAGTISFTVWDNGIGIAAEQIPLLFKPFVQLDGGLAREYAGTGLGLALVDKMINLHGGTVSVESEKDKGSRFTITLPWDSAPASPSVEKTPQLLDTKPKIKIKSVGSILLVEDTEEIIILLNDYLTHKGYTVSIARNGAEGVDLALQEHPDIILMDVMMPVMDGLQATRKIRTEESLKRTPIIGLTSLAMPGDYDNCIAAGMTNYISKPVELKKLTAMINQYLTENGKGDK